MIIRDEIYNYCFKFRWIRQHYIIFFFTLQLSNLACLSSFYLESQRKYFWKNAKTIIILWKLNIYFSWKGITKIIINIIKEVYLNLGNIISHVLRKAECIKLQNWFNDRTWKIALFAQEVSLFDSMTLTLVLTMIMMMMMNISLIIATTTKKHQRTNQWVSKISFPQIIYA